jgi:hypothetical protein
MGKFRGLDTAPGHEGRAIRDLQRQIRELRAAKTLRRSSFADVPTGSIPLSAVGNSSAPGYVYLSATAFALSTVGANVIDSLVTVPTGFTSCVVYLTGRVFAYNSTAVTDYLYARPVVNGAPGNALPVPAATTAAGTNVAPFSTVLTGLTPGGTFSVQLWASTLTAGWASDPANTADLSGVTLWF